MWSKHSLESALIIFWQNTVPANIRKWVFSWNQHDGITWRNYKFAWNSWTFFAKSANKSKQLICWNTLSIRSLVNFGCVFIFLEFKLVSSNGRLPGVYPFSQNQICHCQYKKMLYNVQHLLIPQMMLYIKNLNKTFSKLWYTCFWIKAHCFFNLCAKIISKDSKKLLETDMNREIGHFSYFWEWSTWKLQKNSKLHATIIIGMPVSHYFI